MRKRGNGLVVSVEQRWLAVQGDAGAEDGVDAAEPVPVDDLTDYEKSDAIFATVHPQERFRLNLAPILRCVELEKLDFAIVTSGYDHVVLQSDGQDW